MKEVSDAAEGFKIEIHFEEKHWQKDWVHPVHTYTMCLGKLSRACHPQAIIHLLPTYTNNSEAEPGINTNTNRRNRVHMVATLLGLTLIFPDGTCCLYLGGQSYLTQYGHRGPNNFLPLTMI